MSNSNALEDRLQRYVVTPSGCWDWTGSKHPDGYGMLWLSGRHVYAHRATYERWVGPIPSGLQLDHLCRNRGCVNPEHLEPVTSGENTRRSPLLGAARTHCPKGHPYSGSNLYVWTNPTNGYQHRKCRTCRAAAASARWRNKQA